MVNKKTLDRAVYHYCGEVVNQNVLQRKTVKWNQNGNFNKYRWDYPATAVACSCYDNPVLIEKDYSRGVKSSHLAPILANKLRLLGTIGEKSNICNFIIGRCAEPHAANKIIKKTGCKDLANIYFSVAMRPRTREIIEYCNNCKSTFPSL